MGVHDKYMFLDRIGQGSGKISRSAMDSNLAYDTRLTDYKIARKAYTQLDGKFAKTLYELDIWQKMAERGEDPPFLLAPNGMIYELWAETLRFFEDNSLPMAYKKLSEEVRFFEVANTAMMPEGSPAISSSLAGTAGSILSDGRIGCALWSVGEDVLDTYRASTSKWEEAKKKHNKDKSSNIRIALPHAQIYAVSMGFLAYIKVGKEGFIMTSDHVLRFVESMKMLRNFSIHMAAVNGAQDSLTSSFMRWSSYLGVRDQAGVGEGYRVARAHYIARLSQSFALGEDPAAVVVESYDGKKRRDGEYLIDRIESTIESPSVRIDFSHGFKYVLDPDIDMVQCFKESEGTKESNPVVIETLKMLRSYLVRSLYASCHKDGLFLKLTAFSGTGETELVSLSSAMSPDLAKIENVPIIRWTNVSFAIDDDLSNYQRVDVKVKDKSNAQEPSFQSKPIETKYDHSRLTGKEPEIRDYKRFKKGNDVVDFHKTGHVQDVDEAIARFYHLIEEHEAFERDHMPPGGVPEDIESKVLEDFLFSNPDVCHYILTEPKLGERQKRFGRIFYIACQAIKLKLSLVEKLAKRVTRAQIGNSLVSSFRKRQSDILHLAHATNQNPGGFTGIFVNFDMTAFSKNFPMAAVRLAGSVLADMTGDSSLRRLDIMFRSAVVAHSTRGVEGLFGGVMGGFEGFLNFVWTMLHTSIMEMALGEARRSGIVLAYSDDGVLYFLVKSNEDHFVVRRIISQIQSIYKDTGLIFHIGKTLVAGDVMEYLGDVATCGRFIYMGVKSISKLGILEIDNSVSLFSESINSICGQARAAIRAKCDDARIMPILYTEIHRKICRKDTSINLTVKDTLVIMMFPPSVGGLGVPCYHECALVSEEDSEDWFIHKVIRLSNFIESTCQRAAGYTVRGLISEDTPSLSMMLGSRIDTTNKKISGRAISSIIAKIFAEKTGMEIPADPLDEERAIQLHSVLSNLEGMPPAIFRELLDSSPMMIEYTRAVAITRSRGASRILSRRKLRKIQGMDTRRVREALRAWAFALRNSTRIDLADFIANIQERGASFGFKPISVPLISLTHVSIDHEVFQNEACAVVQTDLSSGFDNGIGGLPVKVARDFVYFAPPQWKSPDMSTVISAIAADGTVPRRFIEIASRIIREDPSLYPHIVAIGRIMKVDLPALPSDVQISLDRLREYSRGKHSIEVNIPPVVAARSTVDLSFRMKQVLSDLGGATRSVVSALAMITATSVLSSRGSLSCIDEPKYHRMALVFSDPDLIIETNFPLRSTGTAPIINLEPGSSRSDAVFEMRNIIRDFELEMETMVLGQIGADRRTWVARTIGWKMSRSIIATLYPAPGRLIEYIRRQTDDQMVTRNIAIFAMRYAYVDFLGRMRRNHSATMAQSFMALIRRNSNIIPSSLMSREIEDDLMGDDITEWVTSIRDSDSIFSCFGRTVIRGQGLWSKRVAYISKETIGCISRIMYERREPAAWHEPFLSTGDIIGLHPSHEAMSPTANELVNTLSALMIIGYEDGVGEWRWDDDRTAAIVTMMYEYAYRAGSRDTDDYINENVSGEDVHRRCFHLVDNSLRYPSWAITAIMSIGPYEVGSETFRRRVNIIGRRVNTENMFHRSSDGVIRSRYVASRVRDMMDDYMSRHVVVLGRNSYNGPDPESLLRESNDAVLSLRPPLNENGMVPIFSTSRVNTPTTQARIATAHLLHLVSYLGKIRPQYVSSIENDPVMTSALSSYGVLIDSTLSQAYSGHVSIISSASESISAMTLCEFSVICLGYSDGRRAVSALAALCAYYEGSMSMTSTGSGVDCVTYVHGAIFCATSPAACYDDTGVPSVDDSSNMTVPNAEEHLNSLLVRSGYVSSIGGVSIPIRRTTLMSRNAGNLSVSRMRAADVFDNEPLICAAASLCTSGASPSQKIWAMCLFMSALWGREGRVGHMPIDEFNNVLFMFGRGGAGSQHYRQGILADVSATFSFFIYNPVIPSASVSSHIRWMNPPSMRLPDRIINFLMGSVTQMMSTRPISDIDDMRAIYTEGFEGDDEYTIQSLVMAHPMSRSDEMNALMEDQSSDDE
jgi:hypothetical protein